MLRIWFISSILFLSGCATTGWDHQPLDYGSMIKTHTYSQEPLLIEIANTNQVASQSMTYMIGVVPLDRKWDYNQGAILRNLARETQASLGSEPKDGEAHRKLIVSGNMKTDWRGDYTATLKAELFSATGIKEFDFEAKGFVESKVASAVAFENAYKIAFSNLVEKLVTPNNELKAGQPAAQVAP